MNWVSNHESRNPNHESQMSMPDYSYERRIWKIGKLPAGVDEAGRGPLAGPVVAAAVILPKECEINGLNDSKKLSHQKREILYHQIKAVAVSIGVGIIEPDEIDRINILRAALLAMEIAVKKLNPKPDFLLIDGNIRTSLLIPQQAVIGGDSICNSIAAASIIAKITINTPVISNECERSRFLAVLEMTKREYFSEALGFHYKVTCGGLETFATLHQSLTFFYIYSSLYPMFGEV